MLTGQGMECKWTEENSVFASNIGSVSINKTKHPIRPRTHNKAVHISVTYQIKPSYFNQQKPEFPNFPLVPSYAPPKKLVVWSFSKNMVYHVKELSLPKALKKNRYDLAPTRREQRPRILNFQ